MSSAPYLATTSHPSLRELPGVEFQEMPQLKGEVCRDMYGDFPYGLFIVPRATIRGGSGYMFTSDGAPIREQNADFLRKKKFLKPRFEEAKSLSGQLMEVDELVSLVSRCDTCFWHWVMDSLPKIILAEESGFCGGYLVPPVSAAPWATESVLLLGIAAERIVYAQGHDLRVERLYVPTYFCGYNAHFNIPFTRLFRERIRTSVGVSDEKPTERIFIGRRESAKVRRVLNQDAVAKVTAEFGFRTVYFEDLSFRRQLEVACAADAIVGSHGSGLTHSLFMVDRSLVVELFPFERRQSCDCYEALSLVTQHRYQALESKVDRESDIEVCVDTLRALLAKELTG